MNSNTKPWRLNDNDDHSQSSDEKMDTGSESFVSNTPTSTSVLSPDSDERVPADNNVLRLNNPESVLRLAAPDIDDAKENNASEHDCSLVTKMENLNLNSPTAVTNGTSYLSISPPRLSSTLTLTTDHPLMGLFSPDGNYPDLIPKTSKIEEDKNLSLSSIEDERPNDTNGYNFFREKNNSKNNLYYSDNFVTADSQILDVEATPPDVARVVPEKKFERRRIIPKITPVKNSSTPDSNFDRSDSMDKDDSGVSNGVCDKLRLNIHSTPQPPFGALDIHNGTEEFHSGVADWCESPSQLHSLPNFELPIELSTNITSNTTVNKELESPDLISSSTQEDKSTYQAMLDPYTGSVALQHRPPRSASGQRRKIQLPPEEQDDRSLDSVSVDSMGSEAEAESPAAPGADEPAQQTSDDEDMKSGRSRSTVTVSECSDLIPEYSAAEELRDERSWLTVPSPGGGVKCDMKVIEPFKRVVSHGGYDARGAAIIVFGACHLPDAARPDYRYVMDNLFLYVIWTLERLVTDEYVLVYLHGSAARRRLPSFRWLHECYKLIDRRLRKSLKHLYLVHPTFWLKSFVILTKPFVSSKFFRKLSYVRSLAELAERVPVEPNAIPDLVKRYDAERR